MKRASLIAFLAVAVALILTATADATAGNHVNPKFGLAKPELKLDKPVKVGKRFEFKLTLTNRSNRKRSTFIGVWATFRYLEMARRIPVEPINPGETIVIYVPAKLNDRASDMEHFGATFNISIADGGPKRRTIKGIPIRR